MEPVKFTFDTEFETARSKRKPALPPAPSYSQAELDGACAAAAAKARDHGRREAEAETAAALAAATARLEARLAEVAAALGARDGRLEAEAARLGHVIAGRLCEALSQTLPLVELEALVGAVLREVRDEPRLAIHVADDITDAARERFLAAARAAAFPGEITVLADGDLKRGDCRIEWAQGSALRDSAALAQAVEDAVGNYVAARRAPPKEP